MTPTTMNKPVAPIAYTPATAAPTAAIEESPSAILGTYKRQAPLFVRGEGVHLFDAESESAIARR